jgi:hypothetical protein
MFSGKLAREARESAAALKAALVALYERARGAGLTPEERSGIDRAIQGVKARLDAETMRLGGARGDAAAPRNEGAR